MQYNNEKKDSWRNVSIYLYFLICTSLFLKFSLNVAWKQQQNVNNNINTVTNPYTHVYILQTQTQKSNNKTKIERNKHGGHDCFPHVMYYVLYMLYVYVYMCIDYTVCYIDRYIHIRINTDDVCGLDNRYVNNIHETWHGLSLSK